MRARRSRANWNSRWRAGRSRNRRSTAARVISANDKGPCHLGGRRAPDSVPPASLSSPDGTATPRRGGRRGDRRQARRRTAASVRPRRRASSSNRRPPSSASSASARRTAMSSLGIQRRSMEGVYYLPAAPLGGGRGVRNRVHPGRPRFRFQVNGRDPPGDAGLQEAQAVNVFPSPALTRRFLVLCEQYGSERLIDRLGRASGMASTARYGVSSAPNVVTVGVAGARVTLTAMGEGTAVIRVTATDPGGLDLPGCSAAPNSSRCRSAVSTSAGGKPSPSSTAISNSPRPSRWMRQRRSAMAPDFIRAGQTAPRNRRPAGAYSSGGQRARRGGARWRRRAGGPHQRSARC